VTFESKSPAIENWTVDQAARVFSEVSLNRQQPSGQEQLSIPLDEPVAPQPSVSPRARSIHGAGRNGTSPEAQDTPVTPQTHHTVNHRSAPIRRDSLKRRESLAKGKEGSRRRQRWENDRLLHVPGAQPPLPSDWAQPTWSGAGREEYKPVPYFLAPLWDAKYSSIAADRRGRKRVRQTNDKKDASQEGVAKEIRDRLKKSRGAKGLLQDLEAEVRNFLSQMEAKAKADHDVRERDGLLGVSDESDDEIVFVGRSGDMRESRRTDSDDTKMLERMVFQSLEKDHGASFGYANPRCPFRSSLTLELQSLAGPFNSRLLWFRHLVDNNGRSCNAGSVCRAHFRQSRDANRTSATIMGNGVAVLPYFESYIFMLFSIDVFERVLCCSLCILAWSLTVVDKLTIKQEYTLLLSPFLDLL